MAKVQAGLLLRECGFVELCKCPTRTTSPEADDASGRWIFITGDRMVRARCDTRRRRLIIQADIGITPPPFADATHELLLIFNDQCGPAEIRMAVDPEDGAVVLVADLELFRLNSDALRRALAMLLKQADSWQAVVAQGIAPQVASATPAGSDVIHV